MGNGVAEGWWRGGGDCNHIEIGLIGVGKCGIVFDHQIEQESYNKVEQPGVVAVGEGYLLHWQETGKTGLCCSGEPGKGVNIHSRQGPASFIMCDMC